MVNFKLIARNVHVYSNLEVRLKSRTTKEEANKEVERMADKKDLFKDYDWKIEGCEDGGINNFDNKLTEKIVERIEQEETEEAITETKTLCENPFDGYDWKIENCDENSINEFNDALKSEIQQVISKDIEACIEEIK